MKKNPYTTPLTEVQSLETEQVVAASKGGGFSDLNPGTFNW